MIVASLGLAASVVLRCAPDGRRAAGRRRDRPGPADYVTRGIARAESEGALLVVLQIDTPGGLDTSMREIIKAILAARVPVAAFVAPSGARAASAGTYILYASHVAAMAPGTNLGAATPVQIGMPGPQAPAPEKAKGKGPDDAPGTQDTLTRKQVHDAAAYIRGFAQLRGRNAEWAERAVARSGEPVGRRGAGTARDRRHRARCPAAAGEDRRPQGRGGGRDRVLATAGAAVAIVEPDWKSRPRGHHRPRHRADPADARRLRAVLRVLHPGMVLPGVVGGICLLLGLFALQMLPVNYAGLA